MGGPAKGASKRAKKNWDLNFLSRFWPAFKQLKCWLFSTNNVFWKTKLDGTSNPLLGWGLPPPLQPAWIAYEGWLLGTWSSPFYEIGLGAIVTVWIFSHLVPLASSYTQFCTPRRPARIARIPSTRDEAGLAFKGSFIQPSFIIDRLSPAFRFSSSVPPGLGGLSSTVSAYDLSVFLLNLPLGLGGFSSIGL